MRLKKRFVALAALVGAIAAISAVAFAVTQGTYNTTADSFNGTNAPGSSHLTSTSASLKGVKTPI